MYFWLKHRVNSVLARETAIKIILSKFLVRLHGEYNSRFIINLTLQTTTKNSLSRAEFDASSNPARDNEFFVVVCSVRLI